MNNQATNGNCINKCENYPNCKPCGENDSKLNEELLEYQKLTKFQKDLVDSLKAIGFSWVMFSTYQSSYGKIKVKNYTRQSDVYKKLFELGKLQKTFEIQTALGIN